jgi:hypothetical protein
MIFIASAKTFRDENGNVKKDKNKLDSVVLRAIAGEAPRNNNVLSGTIAQSEEIKVGATYMMSAEPQPDFTDPETGEVYTNQYSFNMLKELDTKDLWELGQQVGELTVHIEPTRRGVEAGEPADLGVNA